MMYPNCYGCSIVPFLIPHPSSSSSVRPSGLEPCAICGRTFLPESLARHAPICQKNASKGNRKQFDTAKQRLSELEISQIHLDNAAQTKRGKENTPVSANQEVMGQFGFSFLLITLSAKTIIYSNVSCLFIYFSRNPIGEYNTTNCVKIFETLAKSPKP